MPGHIVRSMYAPFMNTFKIEIKIQNDFIMYLICTKLNSLGQTIQELNIYILSTHLLKPGVKNLVLLCTRCPPLGV